MKPSAVLAAVFCIASALASAQTYTLLYSLQTHPNDPLNPGAIGLLSQGRDGRLYTTAPVGGMKNSGVAFAFTTSGALSELFSFGAYPAPNSPTGGLTMGTDGNFVGTTPSGGSHLVGTVFGVPASGGPINVLWNFTGKTDEGGPAAGLTLGNDGNFYGAADAVYSGTYGTLFKMTPSGTLTTLHSFKFTDGATPYQLILGLDGSFYGVTRLGGSHNMGVVFRASTSGGVTVLHNFSGYPSDGNLPVGTLVQANDGTLYGTTYYGGSKNIGTVFKISPAGTGYAVLHNFDRTTNVAEGAEPLAGIALGTDGNLYGTTSVGGKLNAGALFKITPAGAYTTLHSFCSVTGCKDGLSPQTAMVQHTNGNFYGLTRGNSLGGGVFYSVNAGLKPFVHAVLWSGKVGATIQVLGQGFNSATAVKIGGTTATFIIVDDTYLTATVPSGTSGPITVTTSGGTLTSYRKFQVRPTLASFSPASGAVGSTVVLTGTGLTQTSKVAFAGKTASFVVNSDTKVTATVPAGAVDGTITITTAGGAATSATAFNVL